ncbi:MAG TPA: hypothetical protein PK718_02065 [Candidatus Methanofastidiosa archaeon]|nr:hypothetical protein [Candidatus Methanofastidiosa archaeon]
MSNVAGTSVDPYRRSNSISLDFCPDDDVREAVLLFKESTFTGRDDLILRSGQNLLNALNGSFCIEDGVELVLRGKRPSRRKVDPATGKKRIVSSTHGKYYPGRSMIALYTLTATGKRVAYKTLFNTLIHEFCHHMDYRHPSLRLERSLHTRGFYERLNSIYIPLRNI